MSGLLLAVLLLGCTASRSESAPLLLSDGQNNAAGDSLQQLLDVLSGARAGVIDLQRELVARPAVGPEYGGTGEDDKARWIEAWLAKCGALCERLDFPDERVPAKVRPNLIATYPRSYGPTQKPRTLWLLSHLDVAAAGPRELWQGDPFALRVDGDFLYGRGAEDNNQAITSSLLLMDSLRKTGITPPLRLGLLMTSGALYNYTVGIRHVLEKKPDLFGPDDLIVVMDYGNKEGSLFGVSEKGNIWLKITISGKVGHAGSPEKVSNPFAAGAALAHGLRLIEQQFSLENQLFSTPRVTITPTRTEDFSTAINHIPAHFIFYVDARITPEYSFDDVEKAINKLAEDVEKSDAVDVTIKRVEETPPARITPPDAPVLTALERAVRAQLKVEPSTIGTGSVTVAATLRDKGLNVVVWGVQETLHNRPEEYALISAHIKQAQVLARLLFEDAAQEGDPTAD